jgi:hypothetical protein
MSTEAEEYIVSSHYIAMPGEDTEAFMFGVVICSVYIHETVIVTCGYK